MNLLQSMAKHQKVQLLIYCTDEERASIQRQAKKERRSQSEFILKLVDDHLSRVRRGELVNQ